MSTKFNRKALAAVMGAAVLIGGAACANADDKADSAHPSSVAEATSTTSLSPSELKDGEKSGGGASEPASTLEGIGTNRESGPAIPIKIEGDFKPNQELFVSTPCGEGDVRATAKTTFGESAVLRPAADEPVLIGTIKAPNNIGPGPDEGHHLMTVRCDSGANSTVRIPSSGNGDAQESNFNAK